MQYSRSRAAAAATHTRRSSSSEPISRYPVPNKKNLPFDIVELMEEVEQKVWHHIYIEINLKEKDSLNLLTAYNEEMCLVSLVIEDVHVHLQGGFLPNVFKVLAHRPAEFQAFSYYNALLNKESCITFHSCFF